jgi:hypothetical protein
LLKRSSDHNVIGTKWVFRNKQDGNGIIVRNKARLLAQGYSQVEGLDFVIPRSEKEGTKPPYVCPGCSNHTHDNNMINRGNVTNKQVLFLT